MRKTAQALDIGVPMRRCRLQFGSLPPVPELKRLNGTSSDQWQVATN